MAMRAKELGSLGMQVNEKGQVIASKSSLVSDIETELVEEAGLKCCICLEGYRNQPNKVRECVRSFMDVVSDWLSQIGHFCSVVLQHKTRVPFQ